MKTFRIFTIAMVFLLAVGTLEAQVSQKKELKTEKKALRKLEGNQVATKTKNAFSSDFASVKNAKWSRDEFFDVATFMQDGKEVKAYYDFDSNLVGTTQAKTLADLPESARKEISKKYKDYKVGPILFFKDNEANETDMFLYGNQFEDVDNYFVELSNNTSKKILQVLPDGEIFFFKEMK